MSNSQQNNGNGNRQNQSKSKRKRAGGQNGQPKKKRKANNGNARPMGPRETVAVAQFIERPYREPRVRRTSARTTVIGNEEFLVNVTGSDEYAIQRAVALNPGLADSMPWLSIEAQGWERYKFRKLNFRYTTCTGSTTPGTVIMAPDYDAADAPPSTEQVALTYKDRQYCPAWECDKLCRLSPASMNAAYKEHFVRTGPLAANQDIKTYDVGNLFICTSDGTAVKWGKLFVEYEVDFFGPQLPPSGPLNLLGGAITGQGVFSDAAPLGDDAFVDVGGVGFTVDYVASSNLITFTKSGTIAASARFVGTAITAAPTIVGTATEISHFGDFTAISAVWSGTYNVVAGDTLGFNLPGGTTLTSSSFFIGLAPTGSLH